MTDARWQTYRDQPDADDPSVIHSVPDKVVTEPPVGVRCSLVVADPHQDPTGGHYDGPPANLNVVLDDLGVRADR